MQHAIGGDATSDERNRLLAVGVALLAVAIDQITAPAIAPAARAIGSDLRIDAPAALWIAVGFNAAYFAAIATSFWFITVVGKRRYFGSTCVGFALASIACALATSGSWLLVARVAQGLTLGGVFTAALLTIMGACPPKRLPIAFACFAVVSLAVPALAPTIAGYAMSTGTWRAVFVLLAIPALAVGLGALALFRDPYPARRRSFDVLTFATLAAFVLSFQYLVNAAATASTAGTPGLVRLGVIAVVALALYVLREGRSDAAFFDLRLFETPLVGQGATTGALLGVLLAAAGALLQFVLGPLHFTPAQGAALLAAPLGGILVGVPLITVLSGRNRLGTKPAMLIGLALLSLAFLAQHAVSTPGAGWWPFAAIGVVQGFAFAFVLGPLAAAIFASVSPAELPSMAVIFKLSMLIGASLSAPLAAAFLHASIAHDARPGDADAVTRAYADLWIAGAAVALVAALIVSSLRIPAPHAGEAVAS